MQFYVFKRCGRVACGAQRKSLAIINFNFFSSPGRRSSISRSLWEQCCTEGGRGDHFWPHSPHHRGSMTVSATWDLAFAVFLYMHIMNQLFESCASFFFWYKINFSHPRGWNRGGWSFGSGVELVSSRCSVGWKLIELWWLWKLAHSPPERERWG